MPRAGKIEEVSMNDEVEKERGNRAFLFALTFDGKHVEVTSVQDGTTKHDKENMVVMYIMMKGSDGYEIYDDLEELFAELAEAS